jgi:hypothetical protein
MCHTLQKFDASHFSSLFSFLVGSSWKSSRLNAFFCCGPSVFCSFFCKYLELELELELDDDGGDAGDGDEGDDEDVDNDDDDDEDDDDVMMMMKLLYCFGT